MIILKISLYKVIKIWYYIIVQREQRAITDKAEGKRNLKGKGVEMSEEMTLEEQKANGD